MAVNLLLSFAFHGSTDLHEARKKMPCGRILVDSGAFSAWSTGKVIRLQEYAEFLQGYEGAWDHAITLDTIGDPVATKKNTQKLHAMGIPVMPVFTIGDTLAEFDAMIKESGYVCVGGVVGMNREHQVRRVSMLQRRAEDLGGGIHALGVGATDALVRSKPYSADASNVSGGFRFGTLVYWDGSKVRNASVREPKKFLQALPHLARHDIDVARLLPNRRMPVGDERRELMLGMSYAYAVADEYLKERNKVPVPEKISDLPGTHLYSSASNVPDSLSVMDLDTLVHSGQPTAPVWSRYKRNHQCRVSEGGSVDQDRSGVSAR